MAQPFVMFFVNTSTINGNNHMKKAKFFFISFMILTGFLIQSESQIAVGNTMIDTNTIASNLDTPWEILWGPDDHIWITERFGKISRLNPETSEITELVTINEAHEQGEAGLLGMVLHPDFINNPYVFVVYNYLESSSIKERLVKYTYSNGELVSPVILLEGISGAGNHNGSRLIIDSDHKIYMTTGDAANTSFSQNLNSLSGKVLRLNLDGTVPEDNPFPGSFVWTWGHRNAQGLVISPSGIMYSSEHGPSSDDEMNIIEKGRNYGWPNVKGFCDEVTENLFCADSNVFEPIAAWTPTLAVAGTDFYDNDAIPEWQNSLLVTSLKASRMVALKLSQDGRLVLQEESFFQNWYGRLRDICISPDGRVFLAVSNKDGRGTVRQGDDRIVEIVSLNAKEYCNSEQVISICPGEIYNFNGLEITTPGTYIDTISNESGCDSIVSLQIDYFDTVVIGVEDSVMIGLEDTVTLTANEGFISYKWNDDLPTQSNTLTVIAPELGEGIFFYAIEVENANGCIFEDTVKLIITSVVGFNKYSGFEFSVYPNPARDHIFINSGDYTKMNGYILKIINQLGSTMFETNVEKPFYELNLSKWDGMGLYYIILIDTEGTIIDKRKIILH